MSHLISFIKKEFLHIFRDIRTLIILFGIPVTQILLFGFVISNDITDVEVAVLNKSGDSESVKLINKIDNSEYFSVTKMLYSDSDIETVLRKGDIKEVIVIDKDFGKKLKTSGAGVNLIINATDANTAKIISNYTTLIIKAFQKEVVKTTSEVPGVNASVRMVYNEKLESSFMFVPGTMALILMLISAMMTSVSITREKETGTMEILLVSPLHPGQIIVGKVIPYIVLSFVNALSIIAMGYFVFGLPVAGSLSLLMFESILFISVALSLGILISTIVKTQQVAMFISMFALMLPTIILSGFIFPIENMPLPLQLLSNIIPARWFIMVVKTIMIKGLGGVYILKETLILTGFIIFFLALSIKKFKNRLE